MIKCTHPHFERYPTTLVVRDKIHKLANIPVSNTTIEVRRYVYDETVARIGDILLFINPALYFDP